MTKASFGLKAGSNPSQVRRAAYNVEIWLVDGPSVSARQEF